MALDIKHKKMAFLTGGVGFIGSNIASRLFKDGVQLKLLVRKKKAENSAERVNNVIRSVNPENVHCKDLYEVIEGDIKERNLLLKEDICRKLENKIDEVWHCAAALSFDEMNAEETKAINIEGTKNVFAFACKIGARKFHFISTAYVCGDRKGTVFENELDCGQKFKNTYEKSKYEAEKLVKEYGRKYNLQTTIYRPSIVLGDSKTGFTSNFMGYYYIARVLFLLKMKFSNELKKNPDKYATNGICLVNENLSLPVRIPCSNTSTVNLVNVDHLAEQITAIAQSKESNGKVFHIVNPNPPVSRFLCENTLNILGIEGCRFVNLPKYTELEPVDKVITQIERDIYKNCKSYIPYMLNEPIFDNSNVRHVLGSAYKPPPTITLDLLKIILSYAIRSNFKPIS